jgi:hypothetical protein
LRLEACAAVGSRIEPAVREIGLRKPAAADHYDGDYFRRTEVQKPAWYRHKCVMLGPVLIPYPQICPQPQLPKTPPLWHD